MAKFLTMRDVTQLLGISERTVYRLMEDDQLHPIKMGKSWRFEQEDIDAYIERMRQETEKVKRGRKRGTAAPKGEAA